MDQIVDALVVDVDGWMPLFVVLRDDCKLDEALQRDIIARIREACSPRHSPDAVYQIDAALRTISGKRAVPPVVG